MLIKSGSKGYPGFLIEQTNTLPITEKHDDLQDSCNWLRTIRIEASTSMILT